MILEGVASDNQNGHRFSVKVSQGAQTPSELRITSAGNVGINTSGNVYGRLMVNAGTMSNSATEYYGQDFGINILSDQC